MIQHEFAMTACIVAMLTTPPAHAQLERVRVADDTMNADTAYRLGDSYSYRLLALPERRELRRTTATVATITRIVSPCGLPAAAPSQG